VRNARCAAPLALLCLILLAPMFAPHDPLRTNTDQILMPPDRAHPLGTDTLGRDVLSRALYGGQRTLFMAALATAVAAGVGLLFGAVAGWSAGASRLWRIVLDTLLNALLALPGLVLALVVLTLLGTGALSVALAVGVGQAAPFARVARGAVLEAGSTGYVEAARAAGATSARILLRHVLPNARPLLLAYTGVTFGYCLLNSAALSFLGLSGDLGVPEWGAMLYEGRGVLRDAPWVSLVPGTLITLTVLAANRLADSLTGRFR
jgi:peptide/nickel transport system permease protein